MWTVSLDLEGKRGGGQRQHAGGREPGIWAPGSGGSVAWVAPGLDALILLLTSHVLGALREPPSRSGTDLQNHGFPPRVVMCYVGGVSEGLREP